MEHWKKIIAGLVAVAAGVLYLTHAHAAPSSPHDPVAAHAHARAPK